MKKMVMILFIVFSLLVLSGCGSKVVSNQDSVSASGTDTALTAQLSGTDSSVLPSPAATPFVAPAPAQTEAPALEDKVPDDNTEQKIDLDLSQMSGTVVYSQVYNMMYEPEQYIGKTVKMQGVFATQEYNDIRYFACIVQDATACCAQGLEFQMAGDYTYPDDYPEPGAEITVVGTFGTYQEKAEDGTSYTYLVLKNARFV